MNPSVQHYFLELDNNCAEAMLRVLNDRFQLQLREEDYRLVSGFGGGCGCGMICGVLAGAVAALGALSVTERAHITPGFRENCAAFCARFSELHGSTDCSQLRPQYFEPEIRCARLLDSAVECFDTFVQEKGLTR